MLGTRVMKGKLRRRWLDVSDLVPDRYSGVCPTVDDSFQRGARVGHAMEAMFSAIDSCPYLLPLCICGVCV
ncbi:hypothetical protein HA466_0189580 [Hirschfeldia incana]|nr:hypothetical protein HA466_0189580 [Hirschfeldia incana]